MSLSFKIGGIDYRIKPEHYATDHMTIKRRDNSCFYKAEPHNLMDSLLHLPEVSTNRDEGVSGHMDRVLFIDGKPIIVREEKTSEWNINDDSKNIIECLNTTGRQEFYKKHNISLGCIAICKSSGEEEQVRYYNLNNFKPLNVWRDGKQLQLENLDPSTTREINTFLRDSPNSDRVDLVKKERKRMTRQDFKQAWFNYEDEIAQMEGIRKDLRPLVLGQLLMFTKAAQNGELSDNLEKLIKDYEDNDDDKYRDGIVRRIIEIWDGFCDEKGLKHEAKNLPIYDNKNKRISANNLIRGLKLGFGYDLNDHKGDPILDIYQDLLYRWGRYDTGFNQHLTQPPLALLGIKGVGIQLMDRSISGCGGTGTYAAEACEYLLPQTRDNINQQRMLYSNTFYQVEIEPIIGAMGMWKFVGKGLNVQNMRIGDVKRILKQDKMFEDIKKDTTRRIVFLDNLPFNEQEGILSEIIDFMRAGDRAALIVGVNLLTSPITQKLVQQCRIDKIIQFKHKFSEYADAWAAYVIFEKKEKEEVQTTPIGMYVLETDFINSSLEVLREDVNALISIFDDSKHMIPFGKIVCKKSGKSQKIVGYDLTATRYLVDLLRKERRENYKRGKLISLKELCQKGIIKIIEGAKYQKTPPKGKASEDGIPCLTQAALAALPGERGFAGRGGAASLFPFESEYDTFCIVDVNKRLKKDDELGGALKRSYRVAPDQLLQKYDIIRNPEGDGVWGKTAIWELEGVYTTNTHIIRVFDREQIDPYYLFYCLAYNFLGQNEMVSNDATCRVIGTLSTEEHLIPLIPLLEQKEIGNKVREVINQIKAKSQDINELRRQLSKNYFENGGKL